MLEKTYLLHKRLIAGVGLACLLLILADKCLLFPGPNSIISHGSHNLTPSTVELRDTLPPYFLGHHKGDPCLTTWPMWRDEAFRFLQNWDHITQESVQLLKEMYPCENYIRLQHFKKNHSLYSILNDCTFKHSLYLDAIYRRFAILLSHYDFPDFDIIVNLKDEPAEETKAYDDFPAPIFSFQTTDGHLDLPFTYLTMFTQNFTQPIYDWMESKEVEEMAAIPWEKKLDIAIWRGTQTGGAYTLENWRNFPRSQLVLFSQQHSELIDARFSGFTQVTEDAKKDILNASAVGDAISMLEFGRYKYIINMDGNGWAARLPFLFALGSTVLKEESNYMEFWYSSLKPFVHYVPFKSDLSDLEDNIKWMREHPRMAKRIGEHGRQFVLETLREEAINGYAGCLLTTYAQRIFYDIEKVEGAIEVDLTRFS